MLAIEEIVLAAPVRGGLVTREATGQVSADAALTELFRSSYTELVRLSTLLLGDSAAAEEIVQDAFVALPATAVAAGSPAASAAALRRTVVRHSRRLARRRRVRAVLLPAQRNAEPADIGALEALERRDLLHALGDLPARQREVLVLRYYGGLSEAEIADTLGVSRGSVKTHASRGIAAMRSALEER